MSKGSRGIGKIYKRRGSRFWQIELWVRGKRHTESSKSIRREDAEELLKKRIEQYRVAPGIMSRATVGEVLDTYLDDIDLRGLRATNALENGTRKIRERLGTRVAALLEPLDVYELQQELRRTVAPRSGKPYSASTVNITMGVFGQALKLARRNGLISRKVEFPPQLPMNNVRKRFLEPSHYLAILAELPEPYKDPFRFAFCTGWRKMEVLSLRWDEVDFDSRLIRLDPARSKNKEGRPFPFGLGEVEDVLKRRLSERKLGCPFVFHRKGSPVSGSAFLKNVKMAADLAGVQDVVVHDLRRSAARSLVRAGVRESIAMKLVGWKTRGMFQRYDITSESDLHDAAELRNRYFEAKAKEPPRGAVVPFGRKGEA